MHDRVAISFEIDAVDHAALSDIARHSGKSFDEVAASALRARIAEEREWETGMAEGRSDMEAGRIISNEESLARAAVRRDRWLTARMG